MALSQFWAQSPAAADSVAVGKLEASPQFQSGGFKGVKIATDTSIMGNIKTTWKFLFGGIDRTPKSSLPSVPVDLSGFTGKGGDRLDVAWLGHSSLLINIDGRRILTDPVFEKRVSLVGPTRFKADMPLTVDQLPYIDAVIISHDHYDHLNKWSIRQLKAKTGRFIVPLGVGAHLKRWGVPGEQVVELDWWENWDLDNELQLTATPAQHFSGRGIFDRNKTLWASWVISGPVHKVFFSGDSGYFPGFKTIGQAHGPFDMTFLECGAYDLMWHKVHMLPEETVQAHLDLRGRVLHPIHWGTFNLALHPWYEPMERLQAAAELENVTLATPVMGETTPYGGLVANTQWWQGAIFQN